MKAIANRVPTRPCDCNRGMYVWPSTVGPKPNERRSKGRAARNFANDHRGLGQWTGVLEVSAGRMFLGHKGSCDALGKRT